MERQRQELRERQEWNEKQSESKKRREGRGCKWRAISKNEGDSNFRTRSGARVKEKSRATDEGEEMKGEGNIRRDEATSRTRKVWEQELAIYIFTWIQKRIIDEVNGGRNERRGKKREQEEENARQPFFLFRWFVDDDEDDDIAGWLEEEEGNRKGLLWVSLVHFNYTSSVILVTEEESAVLLLLSFLSLSPASLKSITPDSE